MSADDVSQEKINQIVDKYMDIDGDGSLTESEVVKFFSVFTGNPDATADDLDSGNPLCYSHLRVSHMHRRSVCSACRYPSVSLAALPALAALPPTLACAALGTCGYGRLLAFSCCRCCRLAGAALRVLRARDSY